MSLEIMKIESYKVKEVDWFPDDMGKLMREVVKANVAIIPARNAGITAALKEVCDKLGIPVPKAMTHAEFIEHMKKNRGQHVDAGLPAENRKEI
jgi:hypothetical protein